MLKPYDVSDIYAIQTTVRDATGNAVPGLALHFKFRGRDGFSVAIAKADFTAANARAVIEAYATQLADLEDNTQ